MKLMSLLVLTAVVMYSLAAGIYIGRRIEHKRLTENSVVLRPYEGLGSGVLAPGTVVRDNYEGPDSVSGKLDIGGVWRLDGSQK